MAVNAVSEQALERLLLQREIEAATARLINEGERELTARRSDATRQMPESNGRVASGAKANGE